MTKRQQERLRERGRRDYRAGKSILAFYDLPLNKAMPHHTERARAAYEMGWREAKEEG